MPKLLNPPETIQRQIKQVVYEPRCKVCSSPNREDYESLRITGTSLNELSRIAQREYNEKISVPSFMGHMKNHMVVIEGISEDALKSEKDRLDLDDIIKSNLDLERKLVEQLVQGDITEASIVNATKALLTEIRLTIDMLYRLRTDKFKSEVNMQAIVPTIIELIEDVPKDVKIQMIEKLKKMKLVNVR